MTTSKNGRLIYVIRWAFESRGRAENYQPITNEWLLGSRRCAENYFLETIFVENNADVVVRQKQHGRQSNTKHFASRRSRQDRLLTFFKTTFLK